jgi:hypothetical protein
MKTILRPLIFVQILTKINAPLASTNPSFLGQKLMSHNAEKYRTTMPHETLIADRWIYQLLLIRNEMLLQRLKKHYSSISPEKYEELQMKLVNIQWVLETTQAK